jgi:hypothetical protein
VLSTLRGLRASAVASLHMCMVDENNYHGVSLNNIGASTYGDYIATYFFISIQVKFYVHVYLIVKKLPNVDLFISLHLLVIGQQHHPIRYSLLADVFLHILFTSLCCFSLYPRYCFQNTLIISMAPPKFADLNKQVSDIFNKGFCKHRIIHS